MIGPRKPCVDDVGDQAAVVEMGVGQEDRVERRRVEPERDAVADGLVGAALEHAAVDEDPGAIGDEQELRAGDGRRAAEEVDLHRRHRATPRVAGSVDPRRLTSRPARGQTLHHWTMICEDRSPGGAQRMASYSFVTEWRLDAPIERVYEAIHDSLAWPDWWPAVKAVEEIRPATDRSGIGSVRRYTFKGSLPYTLSFDLAVERIERPDVLAGRARASSTGRASGRSARTGGQTVARYDWNIRTTQLVG